jgi:hypothetical protein
MTGVVYLSLLSAPGSAKLMSRQCRVSHHRRGNVPLHRCLSAPLGQSLHTLRFIQISEADSPGRGRPPPWETRIQWGNASFRGEKGKSNTLLLVHAKRSADVLRHCEPVRGRVQTLPAGRVQTLPAGRVQTLRAGPRTCSDIASRSADVFRHCQPDVFRHCEPVRGRVQTLPDSDSLGHAFLSTSSRRAHESEAARC